MHIIVNKYNITIYKYIINQILFFSEQKLPLDEQIDELVKLKHLTTLRLQIGAFQLDSIHEQDKLLLKLKSIQILYLDFDFSNMPVHHIQLNNLVPFSFNNMNTLNVNIKHNNDNEFKTRIETYFTEIRSKCQYILNIMNK